MKFRVLIFAALRNLNRNKKRSILTMLGIIIGIAAVITIVALGQGYKDKTIKDMTGEDEGKIVVNAKFLPDNMEEKTSAIQLFDSSQKKMIEEIDIVEKVEYEYGDSIGGEMFEVELKDKKLNISVSKQKASNPSQNKDDKNKKQFYGRDLEQSDSLLQKRVIVIDETALMGQIENAQDLIGSIATINGVSFDIVGIAQSKSENDMSMGFSSIGATIPEGTYAKYFDNFSKKIEGLKITLKKDVEISQATKLIEAKLNIQSQKKIEGKYKVEDSKGYIKMLGTFLNTITTFIASVAAISLLIASIGLMNMMYISVSERTKEIGIKRALGARKRDIKREFLVEGIVITLIGGVFGYMLGIIMANIASLYLEVVIKPNLFTTLLAGGISIVIGIASSYIPATKAANANTVDILK